MPLARNKTEPPALNRAGGFWHFGGTTAANVEHCIYQEGLRWVPETISGLLITHVRVWLRQNSASDGLVLSAVPAYICAAASVEAYLNEVFLSTWAQPVFKLPIGHTALERMGVVDKVVFLPKALLCQTNLDAGAEPVQSLRKLVKLRDELVHYKMGDGPSECLEFMRARGLTLGATSWTQAICTTRGIRWAHDTACSVVKRIGLEIEAWLSSRMDHPHVAPYGVLVRAALGPFAGTYEDYVE